MSCLNKVRIGIVDFFIFLLASGSNLRPLGPGGRKTRSEVAWGDPEMDGKAIQAEGTA